MSVNAVTQYVFNQIDGITVAGYNNPLKVFIAPPVAKGILKKQPVGFVQAKAYKWQRDSMPRAEYGDISTGGQFKRMYNVMVWIDGALSIANPDRSNIFYLIQEQIIGIFSNAQLGGTLTDPKTGATSQLFSIGETGSVRNAPDHTTLEKTLIISSVELTFPVTEIIQG